MTDEQQQSTVADFPLEKQRRHKWDLQSTKYISHVDSTDGNDRTERACEHCKLVKITVLSPDNRRWNEWRHPNGAVFVCEQTPPCVESVKEESGSNSTVT